MFRFLSPLVAPAILLSLQAISYGQHLEPYQNTSAQTSSCSPLPTINPVKGFAANFDNGCYAVKMLKGAGTTQTGDANATYDQIFYQINQAYELVVLGTFPNARFTSATVYDDHDAIVASLLDQSMPLLTPTGVNPFIPGAFYIPDQTYGFKVTFGGGAPITVAPGCALPTDVENTILDASQIHQGLSWTGYPGLPSNFPPHETGANAAGIIQVRKYIDISNSAPEAVIVRQLSNGCPIPASQAISAQILSVTQTNPSPWLHQQQITAHGDFSINVEPNECYPTDPTNSAFWVRTRDYIPLDNGAAAGLQATIQSIRLQNMLSGVTVMRLRFKVPTTPDTPCPSGCTLTGSEDLRYWSLTFQSNGITIATISDENLVQDPNGYVTVIVGAGAAIPSTVTAANYYTLVDLTKFSNYQTLNSLLMRNMLPNAAFSCSSFNVPYFTTETNPEGGYMGDYVPTVDYPKPSQIPTIPTPFTREETCTQYPTQLPVACTL